MDRSMEKMTKIKHISTSNIRPASRPNTVHQIELTPWDLENIMYCYIQVGILFQKPEDEELVQRLKDSFYLALSVFYPLAGRLAVTENVEDKTTCFSLVCNGLGAQFIHAASDWITIADILGPDCIPDHIIHNLCPMHSLFNYEGVSKPLFAAQVTELVDGIFIGFGVNHVVIDGTSLVHFIKTWSEISRLGFDKISQLKIPLFGSDIRDGLIDVPIRLPFSYSELIKGRRGIDEHYYSRDHSLQKIVFHFSKQKVAELKAKANAEMSMTNNVMISSLQALMAHLWRAVIRSKKDINPDEETTYTIVVGVRQRLKPPLPNTYLGNVILDVVVKSTASELLQNGLGWVALLINKTIASMTSEEVSRRKEAWIKDPTFTPNPRDVPITSSVDLQIGSSPRFDMYSNDFGWGRPLAVRSGTATMQIGDLNVYQGAEEGSIDFEACLLPETLDAMKGDAEFMDAVTTKTNPISHHFLSSI